MCMVMVGSPILLNDTSNCEIRLPDLLLVYFFLRPASRGLYRLRPFIPFLKNYSPRGSQILGELELRHWGRLLRFCVCWVCPICVAHVCPCEIYGYGYGQWCWEYRLAAWVDLVDGPPIMQNLFMPMAMAITIADEWIQKKVGKWFLQELKGLLMILNEKENGERRLIICQFASGLLSIFAYISISMTWVVKKKLASGAAKSKSKWRCHTEESSVGRQG